MDGNPRLEATIAYLSRLTGQDISADQPIELRSIQRVAFASWARQAQLPLRGSVINSSTKFSVRDLLAEGDALPTGPVPHPTPAPAATPAQGASWGGIGLDIEDVAALPEAEDYRQDAFYADNFSPAEVAYCLMQANVRASFCGIWAAKEAVLKSGLAPASLSRLIDIQIDHDETGRPTHPNCHLSISHTAQTAVAVCVPKAAPALAVPAMPARANIPASPAAAAPGTSRKRIAALLIIAALCEAAVAIFEVWHRH